MLYTAIAFYFGLAVGIIDFSGAIFSQADAQVLATFCIEKPPKPDNNCFTRKPAPGHGFAQPTSAPNLKSIMARPNEELDTRDALSNSAGTSANDPRPTSVNDSRLQPETPQGDDDRLPVDAGATRTAAFDEGSDPRDEHRNTGQSSDDAATASRH
jgi:hypothetical protein